MIAALEQQIEEGGKQYKLCQVSGLLTLMSGNCAGTAESVGEKRGFLPQLFSPAIGKGVFRRAFVFKHKVKAKIMPKM